ncbi:hypothetical protein [Micromonospora sp. WMMD812]|uniref:hypothetical protein n=1 Tax=Micromonospora sp. WMMD812 TaxID=3015152 RepID=UPI00248BC263|nr:hypothetical protein [Micromonospora sp. WMMD812]WBB69457.1 hypothetical protein O7603_08925 [Micromonospora sp. WMMD812]
MPAVAALALTLALAPAPSPSTAPSPSQGVVGGLLGGVGDLVDGLLGGGGDGTPSATPSASPTQSGGPTGAPAPAPVPGKPSVAPSSAAPPRSPARLGSGGGADDPVVGVPLAPQPADRNDAPVAPEGMAAPVPDDDDELFRWAVLLLAVGVLAVPLVLLVRQRREPRPAAPVASSAGGPLPPTGLDVTGDNVTRLPTNLNAIYELGRLDERLAQERERHS